MTTSSRFLAMKAGVRRLLRVRTGSTSTRVTTPQPQACAAQTSQGNTVISEPEPFFAAETVTDADMHAQARTEVDATSGVILAPEVPLQSLAEEYMWIASQSATLGSPCAVASLPENSRRNRYGNILPYDTHRVCLSAQDEGDSDYINASHLRIESPAGTHYYIATQGPLPHTIGDFWQMVWEQDANLVVMLANEYENGRAKCARYWPEHTGNSHVMRWGSFIVRLEQEIVKGDFTVRLLTLVNTTNGKVRPVAQYHYTEWPDFGVPSSGDALLQLIKEVRCWTGGIATTPTVIHCSAGVGRTGTFCAVDVTYACRGLKKKPQLLQLVVQMRRQRMEMVQGVDQYSFCHTVMQSILAPSRGSFVSRGGSLRREHSNGEGFQKQRLSVRAIRTSSMIECGQVGLVSDPPADSKSKSKFLFLWQPENSSTLKMLHKQQTQQQQLQQSQRSLGSETELPRRSQISNQCPAKFEGVVRVLGAIPSEGLPAPYEGDVIDMRRVPTPGSNPGQNSGPKLAHQDSVGSGSSISSTSPTQNEVKRAPVTKRPLILSYREHLENGKGREPIVK